MKNFTKTVLASAAVALMASCSEKVESMTEEAQNYNNLRFTIAAQAPQSMGRAGFTEEVDGDGLSTGGLVYEFDYRDNFRAIIYDPQSGLVNGAIYFDKDGDPETTDDISVTSAVTASADPNDPDNTSKAIFTFDSAFSTVDAFSRTFNGIIHAGSKIHIYSPGYYGDKLGYMGSSTNEVSGDKSYNLLHSIQFSYATSDVSSTYTDKQYGMLSKSFTSSSSATLTPDPEDGSLDGSNNVLDHILIAGTIDVTEDINVFSGETIELSGLNFEYLTSLIKVRLYNSGTGQPSYSTGTQLKINDVEVVFAPGLLCKMYDYTPILGDGTSAVETVVPAFSATSSTQLTTAAGMDDGEGFITSGDRTAGSSYWLNKSANGSAGADTYVSLVCIPELAEACGETLMKVNILYYDQANGAPSTEGFKTVFEITRDMLSTANGGVEIFEAGKYYQVSIDITNHITDLNVWKQ